jgi:hypothetical protein
MKKRRGETARSTMVWNGSELGGGLFGIQLTQGAKDTRGERRGRQAGANHLDELKHGTDPPHVTARLRFIDRVQRVPDNN